MSIREVYGVLKGATEEAARLQVPVSVAVVDPAGDLLVFHRMAGARLASIQLAQDKAFTAAMLNMPTHQLAKEAQPGRPLYGIQGTLGGRVIIFGGGLPLQLEGLTIGAVGVSGATDPAVDVAIAEAGARTLEIQ